MKKFFKKRLYGPIVLFLIIVSLLLIVGNVYAANLEADSIKSALDAQTKGIDGVEKYIILAFGWLCGIIASAIGSLGVFLISIIIEIAQFNHFTDIPAVVQGWSLVRDICNMFFVLVFLIIAFATILRIESYNAKRALPKLLIMAVLINFSRMIFAFLIDFSQIVMLTFTSQIKGGYMVNAFNMQKLGSLESDLKEGANSWAVVTALILSVVAAFVTLVVLVILLAALLMRIIMLWIYIILSPLVFLGFAFPAIRGYVSRIWQDFVKQLILGPILGFFLWLGLGIINGQIENSSKLCAGKSGFFCTGDFQKFIIYIGILMGGLMVAQSMSDRLGSLSGKLMGAGKAAALGAIGANWAARRWRAFQLQRQAAKEQKAAAFGARAYNLYRAGTSVPKAALRGAREAGARPIYWAKTMAVQGLAKTPLKNVRDSVKRSLKIRKDAFDAFKEMRISGQKEINKNGLIYRLNQKGGLDVVTKDKEGKEQKVQSFSKQKLDFTRGFVAEMTPAMNAINEAVKNKIDKIKVDFSNLSALDLKNIIQSATASKEEKIAAGSLLAAQRELDNRNIFNKVKDIVKDNPYTKKEFDEIADKYYAVWNNTPDELNKKVASKDVILENLDLSQFEDDMKKIVEAAGKEFPRVVDKVASRSAEASKRLTNTIKNVMHDTSLSFDKRKMLLRAYVDRTGNLNEAFGNDEKSKIEYIKNAKVDQLNKLLDHKENEVLLKQHITKIQVEKFKRADKSAEKTAKLERLFQEQKESNKAKEKIIKPGENTNNASNSSNPSQQNDSEVIRSDSGNYGNVKYRKKY